MIAQIVPWSRALESCPWVVPWNSAGRPSNAAPGNATRRRTAARNLLDTVAQLIHGPDSDALGMAEHTIEVCRQPGASADLIVRLMTPRWSDTAAGRRCVERLRADPQIGQVGVHENRLTIRLADEAIALLGADLEAGVGASLETRSSVAGKTYVVEFCDPNANKALHVGHLRNLALGHALASMLQQAGVQVIRQSTICDIGRNICEAMAGYACFGESRDPVAEGVKQDRFVGDCYSRYVASLGDAGGSSDGSPDDPIGRELRQGDDLAQELMQRWMASDPEVHDLWSRIRGWALAGQAATLDRLRIAFDNVLYESAAFPEFVALVSLGLDRGILRREASGAVLYETGRLEYPSLALVRPDGFPTEHMRVISAWHQPDHRMCADVCVHVFGDEWFTSTSHRETVMRLISIPGFRSYVRVTHGMVLIDGDAMKSSLGRAVLIDDVLDRLSNCPLIAGESGWAAPANDWLLRLVALGFFLSDPVGVRPIEFSWSALTDRRRNPGLVWAESWMRSLRGGSRADSDPQNRDYRFVVLQSQMFPRLLRRAAVNLDLASLCRYATHLTSWHLNTRAISAVDRIMSTTLEQVLGAVGLLPADSQQRNPSRSSVAAVEARAGLPSLQ